MKSNLTLRWEVDLTFKVTGRGRIGADGLAFWYTAAKVLLMDVLAKLDI